MAQVQLLAHPGGADLAAAGVCLGGPNGSWIFAGSATGQDVASNASAACGLGSCAQVPVRVRILALQMSMLATDTWTCQPAGVGTALFASFSE